MDAAGANVVKNFRMALDNLLRLKMNKPGFGQRPDLSYTLALTVTLILGSAVLDMAESTVNGIVKLLDSEVIIFIPLILTLTDLTLQP